jgi:hypothetical protein
MYASQQQHAASPSWTPWHGSWDQQSLANFTSHFWSEFFKLFGVRLHMTTAFHPQSDGQSEAVNEIVTMYMHCLTGDRAHH